MYAWQQASIQSASHYHECTRLACVLHSSPQKQQDIKQNRTREAKIWMIERRGLSCILLHKTARLPAACVNISLCACVCLYECPVYAKSSEQMTSMTVRHVQWWAHRDSHSSICWVSSPNQPSWGILPVVIINMASSCLWNIRSTLLIFL